MPQVPGALTQYANLTQAGVNTLDTNLLEVGAECMVYGGVAGGGANAIALTIPLALADYYIGMELDFIASANNTGPATITVTTPVGTLATLNMADQSGTALTANAIVTGNLVRLKLCSSSLNVLTFRLAAASVPVTSVFGRTGAVLPVSGDYSIGQITGAGTMASQNATAVAITGGTITGAALSGNTGPQAIAAWALFNPAGTLVAAYNVGTVTKTGTGEYTVNFSAAFPSANYVALPSVNGPDQFTGASGYTSGGTIPQTTTHWHMKTYDITNGSISDPSTGALVSVMFLHA